MEGKVVPCTCQQLSCPWAVSLVKESTFYPVSAARDEEGEVGGFRYILRWYIPTAFTFSFQHYNNNLMERVDWQMPSKTEKIKQSHGKVRLYNFAEDKTECVHYKQNHLHIPHTQTRTMQPSISTQCVPLIKKKV